MKQFHLLLVLFSYSQWVAAQEDSMGKVLSVAQCLERSNQNKQRGDIKEATRYLNDAAMKVWEDKNYTDAILYFNQSIALNRDINNLSGISKLQSNLGMIYSDLKDFQKSLEYFQLSLDYRLKFGEKSEIISTYINKSVVLNSLKRHDEAAENLEEALRLATEMSDPAQMKSCYGMLAETYEKAGNQEKTIRYFNLYRTFHEMVQRNKVNEARKETEDAKLLVLQAELEKKNKELELLSSAKTLRETEEHLQNMSGEMRSLLENNTKQELGIRLLKREVEVDRLKIADTEAKNTRQKIWISAIVASLVVVFLFSLILYHNYRFKQHTNQQLSAQNEEIKTLNEGLEQQVQTRTKELQKTLVNLEKRNRDLDQFSHVISHNLRGPVANILGLGRIISRNNPADPINIEVFSRLLIATQNLDTVVKDLSIILQVQDNQSIPKEKIVITEALESAKNMLQDDLEKSNLEIKIDIHEVRHVEGVKPYIESILYNLLSNAIKYSSPLRKPCVWLRTQVNDGMFMLTVTDNGIGIVNHDLEKIFEPYKRLTLDGEGKGLGLYLVKTEIEAMGGFIKVTSKEGEGTSFFIHLPQTEV